jgi:hypothetical protein
MNVQARDLMTDVVRRHTKHIGCAAMAVVGEGFRSTVVRSIITGIYLASRAEHPLRVFRQYRARAHLVSGSLIRAASWPRLRFVRCCSTYIQRPARRCAEVSRF